MSVLLALGGTALLSGAFRMILHHERQWQQRRFLSLHGQRRPFYESDAFMPTSWFDEGVTT